MNITKVSLLGAALLPLAACINPNDGTIADKHPITFEKPLPAGAPSQEVLKAALILEFAQSFHEGATIKDVWVGPVRYAKILLPWPYVDYFTCATYTQKNRYGSYMAPTHALFTYRDYSDGRGWRPSIQKDEDTGAWEQYCL